MVFRKKDKAPTKPVTIHRPKEEPVNLEPEPANERGCKVCRHPSEKHYGGPAEWCNHPGCECQGIQK